MKIYLATPYTGTDIEQQTRFDLACSLAGNFMKQGHVVFSPIAHSHHISISCNILGTHRFWQYQNEGWLQWCDELWVAMLPGWDQSTGIKAEIEIAEKMGKPVSFVTS